MVEAAAGGPSGGGDIVNRDGGTDGRDGDCTLAERPEQSRGEWRDSGPREERSREMARMAGWPGAMGAVRGSPNAQKPSCAKLGRARNLSRLSLPGRVWRRKDPEPLDFHVAFERAKIGRAEHT